MAARRSASSAPGWWRARWRGRSRLRRFSRPPCSRRRRSARAARRRSKAELAAAHRRGASDRRAGARRRAAAGRYATARREGAGFRLDGEKHFVLDGHVADALIVAATSKARRMLLSRRGRRARRVAPDPHSRRRPSRRERQIRRRRLPEAAQLPGGALALERTLDVGRAVLAASLCGVAEEAFRRTLEYLKERRQFDRRIGSFQALAAPRRARAYRRRERLVGDAASLAGARRARNLAAFDVAVAKSKASRTAEEVTAECLQMHGGVGMTDAFDIGLYLKRARVDGDAVRRRGLPRRSRRDMLGY